MKQLFLLFVIGIMMSDRISSIANIDLAVCSHVDLSPVDVCVTNWYSQKTEQYNEWRYTCKNGKPYQQVWNGNTSSNCDMNKPHTEHSVNMTYVCNDTPACPYVYYEETVGSGRTCGENVNFRLGRIAVVGLCMQSKTISESFLCNATSYNVTRFNKLNCQDKASNHTYGPDCEPKITSWTKGQVKHCDVIKQ
eukprot:228810_1